jgi:predicted amidophosphoribosyltransferase
MSDEQQAGERSNQPGEEAALLKRRQEWYQLVQECQECQRELEPHWQFCAHCGVRLATQCPGCGSPLPPAGAATCPHCGLAIPPLGA